MAPPNLGTERNPEVPGMRFIISLFAQLRGASYAKRAGWVR